MKIAFSGAHRTGKTTIAKLAAKHLNTAYVSTKPATTTAIDIKTLEGLKGQLALTNRLRVQTDMMVKMGDLYLNNKGGFFDRSMVDVLAYTLVHLDRINETYSPDRLEQQRIGTLIRNIVDRLVMADFTFITVPNIPFVNESGKAGLDTQKEVQECIEWVAKTYLAPNRYFILPDWADTANAKLAVITDVLKAKRVKGV